MRVLVFEGAHEEVVEAVERLYGPALRVVEAGQSVVAVANGGEARRVMTAAERARAYRERLKSAVTSVTDRRDESSHDVTRTAVTSRDVRDASRAAAPPSDSPSSPESLSLQEEEERERAQEEARAVTKRHVTPVTGTVMRLPDPEPLMAMMVDTPLTQEAHDAAAMLGLRDVEGEWSKFRAHHVAKGSFNTARGWYALFSGKWCVDAKRYASREGPRAARPQAVQPAPRGGKRAWTAGGGE